MTFLLKSIETTFLLGSNVNHWNVSVVFGLHGVEKNTLYDVMQKSPDYYHKHMARNSRQEGNVEPMTTYSIWPQLKREGKKGFLLVGTGCSGTPCKNIPVVLVIHCYLSLFFFKKRFSVWNILRNFPSTKTVVREVRRSQP